MNLDIFSSPCIYFIVMETNNILPASGMVNVRETINLIREVTAYSM